MGDRPAGNLIAKELLPHQRRQKQIVLPAGIFIASVERDAAGADGGRIIGDRVVHSGLMMEVDARLQTHRDYAPSVIVTFLDYVDFVAAGGTMLAFPQHASTG